MGTAIFEVNFSIWPKYQIPKRTFKVASQHEPRLKAPVSMVSVSDTDLGTFMYYLDKKVCKQMLIGLPRLRLGLLLAPAEASMSGVGFLQ